MFSAGANYNKLKTNLRLTVNRLKLLEKKKTELAQKARREIADYLANGKVDRARIRVEHIVREDYMVEAMEIIEMYCDLLLARFGLIQQMKTLDDGLAESISSLIWAAPRLQADVQELKVIAEQLSYKYGKQYAQGCRDNTVGTVSEKLMYKLGVQAPPKILVERYLIEIAKSHNVTYEPDEEVMRAGEVKEAEGALIDLGADGKAITQESMYPPMMMSGAMPVGPPPDYSSMPYQPPFSYPSSAQNKGGPPPLPTAPPNSGHLYPSGYHTDEVKVPFPDDYARAPPNYHTLTEKPHPKTNTVRPPGDDSPAKPPRLPPPSGGGNPEDTLPELPAVPSASLPQVGENSTTDDLDFDDLTRRFEELKKKK